MSDARDVIAKALSDRLPSDSRYDIDEVARDVVAALFDAAGGRYIVIETQTGRLGKLEQEPLPYDYGFRWADSEGT